MIGGIVVEGEEELGLQKQCSQCAEWYPCDPEFWYRDKYRKDGLNTYCKACWDEIRCGTEEKREKFRAAARRYRERQRYAMSQPATAG